MLTAERSKRGYSERPLLHSAPEIPEFDLVQQPGVSDSVFEMLKTGITCGAFNYLKPIHRLLLIEYFFLDPHASFASVAEHKGASAASVHIMIKNSLKRLRKEIGAELKLDPPQLDEKFPIEQVIKGRNSSEVSRDKAEKQKSDKNRPKRETYVSLKEDDYFALWEECAANGGRILRIGIEKGVITSDDISELFKAINSDKKLVRKSLLQKLERTALEVVLRTEIVNDLD